MAKALTTLFSFLFILHLQAQPIDIGLTIGAMAYNGDLAPDSPFDMVQQIRPAIGIFGRTSFSQKISAKLMLNFGKVDGTDARSPYPDRGLSFESNIFEANLTGELHLIRIRHTESSFTYPYLFAGVGMFYFNPKVELEDGSLVELQPLGTEGQGLPGYEKKYNRTQLNFPFGMGIRFILNDRWSVSLEAGARYLLTDYLDDVSATVVNHRELFEGNGPLAASLSNPNLPNTEPLNQTYRRGGPLQDWYYLTGILVSYNFGDSLRKAFRPQVPCYSGW
jgi:hypothetical protein